MTALKDKITLLYEKHKKILISIDFYYKQNEFTA